MKTKIFGFAVIYFLVCFLSKCNSKVCNRNYQRRAMFVIGSKNNYEYYPWITFSLPRGKITFFQTTEKNVREICKYYLPDNVNEVIFKYIGLQYLEPGFFDNSSLEQVVILGNNLTTVPNGLFTGTTIKSLVLSENNINHIEPEAFRNMSRLEALSLDYNNIKIFDPEWFQNAKVLYELSLRNNDLKELPEGTTKYMEESHDNSWSMVYGNLNLDNNNIKFVHPKAFGNLRNFGTISLDNNQLFELPENVFENFDFLFGLYMSTNKFICFSNKTIASFRGVNRLFLGNNKLNTECVRRLDEFFKAKNHEVFF